MTPPVPPPRPTVEATTLRVVVVALLAGVVIAWLLLSAAESFGVLGVDLGGWTTPALLLAAAVAGFALAWLVHQRNQVLRRPLSAQRAFFVLVLGKTMLQAGALLTGAYATVVLRNLDSLDIPGPRERALVGGAITVSTILLGLSGWLLERACRIPPEDEDSTNSQES